MALSINACSPKVTQFLSDNHLHATLNNVVLDVLDLEPLATPLVQPNLDLLLTLPDERDMVEYERVSLHSFNSDTKTLTVECSIPTGQLEFLSTVDYLRNILENAIDLASDYFSFQGITFRRDEYLTLIEMFSHEGLTH